MQVKIINSQDILDIDLGLFKKVSKYIADKFDRDKSRELNIIFVDRQKIRQLNKEYRKKDNETDVLSFPYGENDLFGSVDNKDGFSVIGEIVISPEVARENSGKIIRDDIKSWNLIREIILLIIHGILHLYSYDHEKRDEEIKMDSLQDSLLRDVFSNFDI
jgi:probable rRNA maturation factor